MTDKTVVCFGPGPAFKGGMANYNTSLAKTFDKLGNIKVHIVSWTQQYPSIIPREFKDKKSKVDLLEGTNITCTYLTNYNKPGSWKRTADFISSVNPDIVIFQWSIALQGLPLKHIAKQIKKKSKAEVIFDLHFVVQKEKSKIDRFFTKYGIKNSDSYIVHALKTFNELQELFPTKSLHLTKTGERSENAQTVIKLYHPIYDLFQPDSKFNVEKFKKENNLRENVFLFFGFIRKYKGLHNAINAFAKVVEKRDDVSLLICGESFWNTLDSKKLSTKIKKVLFGFAKKIFLGNKEDEKDYHPLELIDKYGIRDKVSVFNEFVPNEDVHKYFQVSNCVVLYYLTATPSGIESLSYNFKLPILATKVGHFPETVKDGFNGYLAEANNIDSMAEQMMRFLDSPLPGANVEKTAENLSWENYARAILNK
ncbi:glycosyltransferase [Maribellus maritimus]|uniref:glycosyltransferase n=1 Tax=Maribellus maritimus TaxID=2870838 RepID=UPI001EEBEA2C|nr:glycosyltransferase [Maribellus maritimus]MCG6188136.1 glycosyltransferase [Maribellus maritimus]